MIARQGSPGAGCSLLPRQRLIDRRHDEEVAYRDSPFTGVFDNTVAGWKRPVLRSRGSNNLAQDRSTSMTDKAMSPLRRHMIESLLSMLKTPKR